MRLAGWKGTELKTWNSEPQRLPDAAAQSSRGYRRASAASRRTRAGLAAADRWNMYCRFASV